MKGTIYLALALTGLLLFSCQKPGAEKINTAQPVYQDSPYWQDYAVKYHFDTKDVPLKTVCCDRNGIIQVLASNGVYRPDNGHFQYPGTLQPDRTYRPMADKKISDMILYENQFVYLDDEAVFSNAWAGLLHLSHGMPGAGLLSGGTESGFLLSDGRRLAFVSESDPLWTSQGELDKILDIRYRKSTEEFLILTKQNLFSFSSQNKGTKSIYQGSDFTCFELSDDGASIVIGTNNGYIKLDAAGKQEGEIQRRLPWTELRAVREINGALWFGSTRGAFMLREDGRYNYYYGKRWLPGQVVRDIDRGPDHSVLVLTDGGLAQICFEEMTLEDKAMIYEKQVRQRHIRYGFNGNVTRLEDHDLATAENRVADSDNLWTGMYMASQLFRYLATASEEAKQNCLESFEAMDFSGDARR